ncbi:MAG TPA: ABC transporter permease [Candidatus Acetothermia bacterium]|nr:ABC transporter permease [Candidatus Bipolaricaulota bacterium]HDJ30024.1 ABC transporter permease [Candidatus Acetothermia bacterium]
MKRIDWDLTIGAGITAVFLLIGLLSLVYTPYPPNAQRIEIRLSPPSLAHPLGTDQLGRDVLSRLMEGARHSLAVALTAVFLGACAGTTLGMIAGWCPGILDEVLMRTVDFIMGFPILLFALLIAAVLGPGMRNSLIAIAVANVPVFARLTRGNLLSLREREFVLAARACGAETGRILYAHLLPNLISPLLIQGTISLGTAILADAGLSYLGLGIQPPHPSWGRMVYEARSFLALDPWLAIYPGLAIALSILGFNLLGDGLRDRFDPRRARRRARRARSR